MKLEMTLPERPGFLHALPLFDLFVLVVLLLLLGPALLSQRGVMVEVAPSQFQMDRYRESVVVTLGPGELEPRLHLGRQAVSMEVLKERLDEMKEDGEGGRSIILLNTDRGTPTGVEREVVEMILGRGFRLGLVGRKAEEEVEE